MSDKSIPLRIDCACGSNLLSGQIQTDQSIATLGFLSLLVKHIDVMCPTCTKHVTEIDDDFTRTVGNLGTDT